MCIEKRQQDFRFYSKLRGKIVFWICGIATMPLSYGLLLLIRRTPELTGRPLVAALSVEVSLWILCCVILFSACDIQILDGQLRFRHLFVWRSVPLESITRVQTLRAPAVYVRADYGGKHYRLIFYPGDFLESSPPPVIVFLEEVCRRNEENYESRH